METSTYKVGDISGAMSHDESMGGNESREENTGLRENHNDDRESSRSTGGNDFYPQNGGHYGYPQQHQQQKMNMPGPYPMVRGNGPHYGFPHPGFMGNAFGGHGPHYHGHYRVPPYGAGSYGGGHPGVMKGPGYHPHPHNPHQPHHQYQGAHYGMPPTYPHNQVQGPSYGVQVISSDSASISSKSSMNSRKKRNFEGSHVNGLPNSYSFRRTDSNSSTASTLTAGNNTSMETNQADESPHKRDREDSLSGVLNMDRMAFDDQHSHSHHGVRKGHHSRTNSGDSTASSLSACGFSLGSIEEHRDDHSKDSSKRQKKLERAQLMVDTCERPASSCSHSVGVDQSTKFEQMSIGEKRPDSNTSGASSNSGRNIFLALSTSPINDLDADATPLKTNTTKKHAPIFKSKGNQSSEDTHRPSDTPTPPARVDLDDAVANDDHNILNRHLRGQSFTPLAHFSSANVAGASPSNAAYASVINPQLSWSIAGDTPSLADLAEWEDDSKIRMDGKQRPSSTSSMESKNMPISPHDFQVWKEDHEITDHAISGTTTPLPMFFEHSNESNENMQQSSSRKASSHGEVHPFFTGSSNVKAMRPEQHGMWSHTPMFVGSEDNYMQSPHDRDFYAYHHIGHGGPGDRIRNLRGRVHPGHHYHSMPLHMPHTMPGHLPMTSPMGMTGGKGIWSPHSGMQGNMASPHHMGSPLANMAQSKRKCVPLKAPIPSKFQGDIEKNRSLPVPEFTSLVNFPSHMSQKQAVNLPDGMRCCVMCGQACSCSSGNKGKKGKSNDGGSLNQNDHLVEKNNGYAIIPTQNKGLCTLCDVNVWVVVPSGLEIKWCKGCKNFRPWAAFGDKGLATKCLRCRERQREKYALQKEEKDKVRYAPSVIVPEYQLETHTLSADYPN